MYISFLVVNRLESPFRTIIPEIVVLGGNSKEIEPPSEKSGFDTVGRIIWGRRLPCIPKVNKVSVLLSFELKIRIRQRLTIWKVQRSTQDASPPQSQATIPSLSDAGSWSQKFSEYRLAEVD